MQRSRRDASHLRAADLFALAGLGLRIRRLRAALSALGICIGIAAIVGVLGITQSSESDLVAQIDRLGTNLLTVQNGRSFNGAEGTLPQAAPGMIGHMAGVEHVSATALLTPSVYRTDLVPAFETGGIGVRAADSSLLSALDGSVLHGTYLNTATSRYRVAVLGFGAAQYLGIDRLDAPARIWIAGRWFIVAGILNRMPLAPEVDQSVLVGWPIAESELGFDGYPTRIYVRAATDHVVTVDNLLAATANPEAPEEVAVSRPSDALAARIAVVSSSTTLVLGLGAIALLVGGVGIANVMFVSVLERRSEIGLRRALGATRGHVALQFLAESLLLSSLGGTVGVAGGLVATATYATLQGWSILVPPEAIWAAFAAAIFIGAAAGSYPAIRASRLSPTDALRSE
ncbi:MAG TPA: ABC transporter permease [Methylomirabilota bacterium]|nr:ABC transporter permease [Methylomirabilota bacterium]